MLKNSLGVSPLSRHGPVWRLGCQFVDLNMHQSSVLCSAHETRLSSCTRIWWQLCERSSLMSSARFFFFSFFFFLSFWSQYYFSWQMSCIWVAPHLLFPECRFIVFLLCSASCLLFSVISSSWPFLTAWMTQVWINHLPIYKTVDSPIKLHCHGRFLLIKWSDAPKKESEVKKSVTNVHKLNMFCPRRWWTRMAARALIIQTPTNP